MKKRLHCLIPFLLILFFTNLLNTQEIPDRPVPARFVVDYVQKLSPAESRSLEEKLQQFSAKTGTQIVVVIIGSLQGAVLEDYSQKLAEGWGIGQKGKDNGLLILTTIQERKVRIETGYGMEAIIPDAIAKRIIENIIVPNFKKNDFFEAYDQATDFIIKAMESEDAGSEQAIANISAELDGAGEDKEAVFGGRIMLYIFWAIILMGAYSNASTKITLKLKVIAYFYVISMVATLVFGEWWYWKSAHTAGFWFFQLLAPFGIPALVHPFFKKLFQLEIKLLLLKKYTKDTTSWNNLYVDYKSDQVTKKFQQYANIIDREKITITQSNRISRFIDEIEAIFKNADKLFDKKSNYELTQINAKVKSQGILTDKKYIEENRKSFLAELSLEISYFESKKDLDLNQDDLDRLNSIVSKAKALIDNSAKVLGIDYDHLENTVFYFFQDERKWISYRSSYTTTSIDSIKKNFDMLQKDLQTKKAANDQSYNSLVVKVYDKIQRFTKNPGSMMTAKPVYTSTYSGSPSSSSSWSSSSSSSSYSPSSSSSSSSSYSSSSSSSYGGGSFGGGGASGSW